MYSQASAKNHAQNLQSGADDKVQKVVADLFQKEPNGLTNNEMIRNFDLSVHTMPAYTAEEKTVISATHQSLKGARNALTKKGTLLKAGERVCSISGRMVEFYMYAGVPKTQLERLQNDIERRQKCIDWNTKKIEQAKAKIAKLTQGVK